MQAVTKPIPQTRFRVWAIISLGVVVLMAVITGLAGFPWFRAVLHGQSVAVYLSVFYMLVAGLLVAFWKPWQSANKVATVAAMIVLGHLAAAASAFTLHVLQHDGVERLRNTITHDGVLGFASAYLLLSAGLGGWLLAPLAIVCTAVVAKRFAK